MRARDAGVTALMADQTGDEAPAQGAHHCPLCASSALDAALPTLPVVQPLAVTRDGYPARFYTAPRPSPIWRTASILVPDLVVATFTDEQTRSVPARASGMESMSMWSDSV